MSYSASQKASAAERFELAAAMSHSDDGEAAGSSHPFHVSSVSTVAGEQEFRRSSDGVQAYGTEAERAASDARFFESVRRGDCLVGLNQISSFKAADEQSLAASLESKVATDLTSLDITTSSESDCPVSTADDAGLDAGSTAGVDVNSL